jgi:hypothetical protein
MSRSDQSICVIGAPLQSQPVMPGYHPEFGYFCPSPLMRRGFRIAMISAAVGMAIGAIIVLSLMDRRSADSQQNIQISTFGRADRGGSAVAQAAALENEPAVALLPDEEKASMPITRDACEDEAAFYLDSKCRLVKRHKAHTSQLMTTRLASVGIGRIRSLEDLERPVSATVNGRSTQADAGQTTLAEGPPAPSIAVSQQVPASAAKPARTPRARRQSHNPMGDGFRAFAYASPYAQYNRYGDKYRSERQAVKGNWGWTW